LHIKLPDVVHAQDYVAVSSGVEHDFGTDTVGFRPEGDAVGGLNAKCLGPFGCFIGEHFG